MNSSKLTPCRKVGLSRRKNTPMKTVEGLLNKKENLGAVTPKISNVQSSTKTRNRIVKNEVSNDTPCRQVGLSRKRKTPLSNFETDNVCTPSPPNHRISENKPCKIEENSHNYHAELSYSKSSVKKKHVVKNNAISNCSNSNEVACSKKLSELFSSPSSSKSKHNVVNNSQDTDCSEENINSDPEGVFCDEIVLKSDDMKDNKLSIDYSTISNNDDEAVQNDKKPSQNHIEESNQLDHCDKNEIDNKGITAKVFPAINTRNADILNISPNDSRFIKVCYSNEKENTTIQGKISNLKKPTFSRELFDDDDFEIGPTQKKPKKCFQRCKTDGLKKEKKSVKNKLKKSLSVGDPRSTTLTDSSIVSKFSSMNSLNECFVKLEQIKESPDQHNLRHTLQDHSDDDFETFTCTPKETKIKNLDALEKEVEEKRLLLEELKRAKIHKKMHSIIDLQELTARWKTGCIDALNDLLKQLNTHSQMSMEMLLRKLSIAEDFIPLSQ